MFSAAAEPLLQAQQPGEQRADDQEPQGEGHAWRLLVRVFRVLAAGNAVERFVHRPEAIERGNKDT